MNLRRRAFATFATFAAGVLACTFGAAALAGDAYPQRPITMIVPFGPGGTSDIMARLLQQPLADALHGTVVVDNRGGAGGAIGMSLLKRAKADGLTIGLSVIGPEVLQPALRDTGYSYQDYDHICRTYSVPLMMLVPADSPFHSVADVIGYARSHPGKLTYGSSGTGTILHLAMAMLMDKGGAQALHVPYKSTGEMVTALKGGQVMLFNETPTIAKQYGLRPLAVFADHRVANFPDVPTMAEAGFTMTPAGVWGGLIAPKGLPPQVRTALESACQKAIGTQAYVTPAERVDTPPAYQSGAAFAAFAKSQSEAYGALIDKLGLAQKQ
ncbi:tripartite tricarboxylate transporter substrate binding protein [Ramlibacter ginsenosidimutans]|uniref:Tripartite tricarboxylate transporter substrate binding protein n=1 Tax=Ramlibacter ginsenosidimutans TaxID=502333 RepID=A0A934TSE9_9BURK|nr:tripartite tricarboxylate transporter substrate binding protein [Ramlibacter ginsenosidimutans]MBK6006579.1 tripartite tricarboxylate transporter substrate binding protein [Ramlibacter ginsenosidimutans]